DLTSVLYCTCNKSENFIETLFDDVRDQFARDLSLAAGTRSGQLDCFSRIDQLRERDAVLLFRLLCFGVRDAEPLREVVGDCTAAPGNGREVTHFAVTENRQLRGAAAEIDECNANILFIVCDDGLRGSERLVNGRVDLVAGTTDRFAQVLRCGDRAGNDVDFRLESCAGHADWITNARLVIDDV